MELQIVHAYKVSVGDFRISRVRNTRSFIPIRYPDGAARSHGFGTPDRTCIEGTCNRKGLQDLTDKEHQIVNAYGISGPGCNSHGFGTTDSTWLQVIRPGLQDLTGTAHQIEPAYTVSSQGCMISRVGYYRSYMPTRHKEGTSGSNGFETQIERAYYR